MFGASFHWAIHHRIPIAREVELGKPMVIVGPNGAGESTLLATLAGCCVTIDGKITFHGIDLTRDDDSTHRMMAYC
jgi:ABC-type cobalamin transport system ATPase subunit